MPSGSAALSIQGSRGPQRLLVWSLSQPINGSFSASHTLITVSREPAMKAGNPAAQVKNGNR